MVFQSSAVYLNHQDSFDENILFTHKGLSGPAILQISSNWNSGESIKIDLSSNNINITDFLNSKKEQDTKAILKKHTIRIITYKNFVANFFDSDILEKRVCDLAIDEINSIAKKYING